MGANSQSTVEILLQARNQAQQAFAEFSKQVVDITSNVLRSADASKTLSDAQRAMGDAAGYTRDAQGRLHDELGRFVSRASDLNGVVRTGTESIRSWGDVFSTLLHTFEGRVVEAFEIRKGLEAIHEAAASAIEAFPEMIAHTTEVGNQLWEMSLKTGASVEGLSQLRFVSSQTGVSLESMTGAMSKLEQGLGSSGPKAEKLQGALNRLGLDMLTLKNERPDEAFVDVLAALEEVPNRADQAALGMQIFGAKFKSMAVLAQEDVHELMEKARELGLVVSTDTASAAHAAEVGFKALHSQWEAVTMHVSAAFLPAIVGVTSTLSGIFADAMHEANRNLDAMGKPGGFIGTVATAMGTGNKAIEAQVQLYDYLRDAVVGLARYGLEPAITAFGFVMSEFNAAKVVFGDVAQGINYLVLGWEKLVLGVEKFQRLGTSGAMRQYFDIQIAGTQGVIEGLNREIDARAKQIDADKKAEDDWSKWATDANAKVEAAVTALSHSHSDAAETIQKYSDMSHKARGQEVDDLDLVTKADKQYAKDVEHDAATITKLWDDAAVAWAKSGEKTLQSKLDQLDAQQQREADGASKSIKLAENREEALAAIQNKYDGLRAQAVQQNADQIDAIRRGIEQRSLTNSIREYDNWAKAASQAADRVARSIIDGAIQTRDAEHQTADLEMQMSLSSTDFQIAKIQEWAESAKGSFKGTAEQAQHYYEVIDHEADLKITQIIARNDPLAQAWSHLNDDMRQQWASTWEKALDGQGSFLDALMSPWDEMKNRWKKVLAAMAADWEGELLDKLGFTIPGFAGGSTAAGGSGSSGGGFSRGGTGTSGGGGSWMSMFGSYFNRGGGQTPGYNSVGGFNDAGEWVPSEEGGGFSGGGGGGGGWGNMGGYGGYAMMGAGMALNYIPTSDPNDPDQVATAGGYAKAGAQYGAIAGPYGMAAGAAIGAIIGALKDQRAKDEIATIATDWGVQITEKLALAMQNEIDNGTFKTEVAASLGHLGEIVQAAGGLKSDNLDMFTGKLRDTFSMIETHQMTVAQGAKVLDDNWQQFAKAGTDANGRLSASLKEIIQLNERFGTQSEQITQYLQQQGTMAAGGLTNIVAGMLDANQLRVFDQLKQKLDAARLSGTGLGQALADQHTAADAASGGLNDLGLQAVATFAAMRAAGKSEVDAIAAIHPALQTIAHAYDDLGISTDDAALQAIMLRDRIVTSSPQMINAIGGLNSEMVALDNMGLLNTNTFAAMQRTGTTMYQRLHDQVQTLMGANADLADVDRETLSQMQTYLQQAAKEAGLLGVPLDENTQRMIDQSVKLGIWHDASKSATDVMTDGINSLVDRMNDLIDALTGVSRRTNDVANTVVNRAHDMVGAFRDVGDEVDRVSFGHSPGGIKEIPIQLSQAMTALQRFVSDATVPFGDGSLPVLYNAFQQISNAISGGNANSVVHALAAAQASLSAFRTDAERSVDFLGQPDSLMGQLIAALGGAQRAVLGGAGGSGGNLGNDSRAIPVGGPSTPAPDMLNQAQLQALAASALQGAGLPVNDATMGALSAASGWNGVSMSRAAAMAFLNSDAAGTAVKAALAQAHRTGNLADDARAINLNLWGDDRAVIKQMAAGGEGRAAGPTWFYTKGDEDYAFSGEGRRFQAPSASAVDATMKRLGDAIGGLHTEFQGLRADVRGLNAGLFRAVRDAVAFAGA